MKELSIEEKAKRYDEAIEKFDVILNLNTVKESGTIFADDVRKILPELKESEDEKIRKAIGYAIGQSTHSDGTLINGVSSEEALAWLEKQGEQKPAEEYNITGIGSKNAQGKLGEMIKNLKSAWSEEDEDMCYKATAVINRLCAEGKEYVWSVNTLKKLFYWLKSLKDRVQPQNKWTPNEEQIEALVSAIDVMIDNKGAGDKNTILLSGLYHKLKAL